jgi:hypothetical protein
LLRPILSCKLTDQKRTSGEAEEAEAAADTTIDTTAATDAVAMVDVTTTAEATVALAMVSVRIVAMAAAVVIATTTAPAALTATLLPATTDMAAVETIATAVEVAAEEEDTTIALVAHLAVLAELATRTLPTRRVAMLTAAAAAGPTTTVVTTTDTLIESTPLTDSDSKRV